MTLFLTFDNRDYFYMYCKGKDYSFEQVFVDNSFMFLCAHVFKTGIQRVPRGLWGAWKNRIKECDKIVISDGAYFPSVVTYIKRVNPKCRIIFYYMNPMSSFKQKYLLLDSIRKVFNTEVYSYSYEDSIKYGLKWNPLHCYQLSKKTSSSEEYDFLFLGRDKGRARDILEFYNHFKDEYRFNIKLVGSNGELGTQSKVKYEDYIQDVYNSKALLEVVDKEVRSYTFRVVEAAIYGKKLITNNFALAELPIYQIIKPNTLFTNYATIGKEELIRFMTTPTVEIDQSDIKSLGIEQWISSFL